ncbi:MAG: hypothetical protein RBR86_03890 [Pseudobdellovibrionaceae bacterium]|nr:hypothetical protein [Pseudobdellovibrionaceae bacterium]
MNLSSQYDIMSQNLQSISHPLVSDLYVKREWGRHSPFECQDVLVIEANFSDRVMNYNAYSALLSELMLALPHIKDQVEDNVGSIDRIDIKTH